MNNIGLRFLSGIFRIPPFPFRVRLSAFIALFPLCSSSLVAQDAWCGGGGYDGYERGSALPAIGCPQANNAQGATNVTALGACLNGMLLATGSAPATVYVYWGATDGGTNKGSWGTWIEFGVCAEWQTLTASVSVNPNTTNYYRFYAVNTDGDEGWAGASASFFSAAPPVLNTGAGAAPVSYTTATLHGDLVGGVSADVYLFWGPNTNAWAGTNSLGMRSQGLFDTPVSGLNPGTVYYYRCYGTNDYGEDWSETAAFTTRVETVSYTGGDYDGYDRRDAQTEMVVIILGTVLIFK